MPDYRYRQCAGQDAGKPQGPVRHKFNHYPATPVGEPGTFLRTALSALHRSGADKFQGNSQIARRSRRQELARQRVDAERRPALARLSELTRARTKAKERAEDSINGLGDLVAWIAFGCFYAFGWGIASGLLTLVVYWMGRSDGHSDGGPLMGFLVVVSLVGYIPALAWPWISRARARTRLKELNVKIEQAEQQLPKPRYDDPRYVWSDAADDWVRPSGTATTTPKQSAPVPSTRTSPSPVAPAPVSGMAPTAGELRSPSMAWVVEKPSGDLYRAVQELIPKVGAWTRVWVVSDSDGLQRLTAATHPRAVPAKAYAIRDDIDSTGVPKESRPWVVKGYLLQDGRVAIPRLRQGSPTSAEALSAWVTRSLAHAGGWATAPVAARPAAPQRTTTPSPKQSAHAPAKPVSRPKGSTAAQRPKAMPDPPQSASPVVANAGSAAKVVVALGGWANIVDVDACLTRLRVTVRNTAQVNKAELRRLGATGVLQVGNNTQAIFGSRSRTLKSELLSLKRQVSHPAAPSQRPGAKGAASLQGSTTATMKQRKDELIDEFFSLGVWDWLDGWIGIVLVVLLVLIGPTILFKWLFG